MSSMVALLLHLAAPTGPHPSATTGRSPEPIASSRLEEKYELSS